MPYPYLTDEEYKTAQVNLGTYYIRPEKGPGEPGISAPVGVTDIPPPTQNQPKVEPTIISPDQGIQQVAEADKTMGSIAPPATPSVPITGITTTPSGIRVDTKTGRIVTPREEELRKIYPQEQIDINPQLLQEPEKLAFSSDRLTPAGTAPSGMELFLDAADGKIKSVYELNEEARKRKEAEDLQIQTNNAKTEVAQAVEELKSFRISDSDVQEEINAIQGQYNARVAQMQEITRRRVQSIETLGARLGSRWTGGEGGVWGGVIAEEERAGLMRIAELEAEKNSQIAAAKKAQREQNWKVYVAQVEMAQKTYDNQIKGIAELNKKTVENNKLLLDMAKEEREQQKSDLENSKNLISSIGYLSLNALTGDEAQDLETIKTIASLYKVDPNKLLSEVQRLEQEKIKYPAGIIGEYQFYRDQAEESGVSQDKIMDFNQYQTFDANRKARAAAVTSRGLDAKQTQNFLRISDNFQKDEIIKQADKAVSLVAIAEQVLANPQKATNQLKSLYILVKNLDADSAVREGELALAMKAQSYLDSWKTSFERIQEGRIISPKLASELAEATKELAAAWQEAAESRTRKYQSQAKTVGLGDVFEGYLSETLSTEQNIQSQEDALPLLEEDINAFADKMTREELRDELMTVYGQWFSEDEIYNKVLELIPDK